MRFRGGRSLLRNVLFGLTSAVTVLAAGTAMGKSDSAKAGAATSASATPQPSPEMQSLAKAFAGTWSIEETFAPSTDNSDKIDTAKGGTGHGTEVWRSGPGGFTFMEEEENFTPAGVVYIVGYMWWDATKKAFGGMECNSLWPQGCDPKSSLSLVSLSWNGKQLVVDFKSEKDPSKLVWHEVFSDITPTGFLQTADVGQADGSLKRWATIHARRVSNGTEGKAQH